MLLGNVLLPESVNKQEGQPAPSSCRPSVQLKPATTPAGFFYSALTLWMGVRSALARSSADIFCLALYGLSDGRVQRAFMVQTVAGRLESPVGGDGGSCHSAGLVAVTLTSDGQRWGGTLQAVPTPPRTVGQGITPRDCAAFYLVQVSFGGKRQMPKKLVPLTPALLDRVVKSWRNEADANDLAFDSGWAAAIAYANDIITNPKPRYAIYVLATVNPDGRVRPPYDRFVHVNHKLPKTPHAEVRFVWTVPSPAGTARREGAGVADQMSDYINTAMECANNDHKTNALRLYLPDRIDHEAAKIFARLFNIMRAKGQPTAQSSVANMDVRVVPQWLILKF